MIIGIFSTSTSYAETTEDAIKKSKVQYDLLDSQIMDLNSKVAELNVEIEKLNTSLEENNLELSSIENEINFTENELEQTKEEIENSQILLDNRIRSIYKANLSSNILLSIITSSSLSDLISRVQSISKIVSVDKKMIAEINEKKQKLDDSMDKLGKKEEELNVIKTSIKDELKEIEDKKYSQSQYIDELNTQKAEVFAIIESNEEKLISHSISVIDSPTSSISEIENAVNTLNGLIPQLNSSRIISMAEDGIYNGNLKIDELTAQAESENIDIPASNENIGSSLKTLTMESTAYTGGGLTFMGLKPVRIPDGISTIAVDPSVIPLGSKVYVSGYGVAIASDTGGAIRGNVIDVYFNSHSECVQWGRRTVTVEILAYPGDL